MGGHGGDRQLRTVQIALALTDAAARLALPIAALGLAAGERDSALTAAVVACAGAALRGTLAATAIERALVRAWIDVADACRRRPVVALPRRREDEESVAVLLEGLDEEASHHAAFVPHAIGIALSTVGITALSIAVLGPVTTLLGAVLLGVLGAVSLALGRGLRAAQREVWEGFGRASGELRLLVEGALELRAAGREGDVAARTIELGRSIAASQARASAASARMALLPAAIAVLAVAGPTRAGVAWFERTFADGRLFEISILAATAVAAALSAVRLAEQWTSTEPRRRRFRAFRDEAAGRTPRRALEPPPAESLAEVPIVFDGFGHAWNDDHALTPRQLDLTLPSRAGVALVGPNGSGKTTVALALLGVVEPTAGRVTIGSVPAAAIDRAGLGGRIGYVPQDPLLVPGASIAWHLRLHDPVEPSVEEMDAALDRVGLIATLESRARARGITPRELPAGELSGGERRRLALARALVRPRELYVLDEPEAALDTMARCRLVDVLAELAEHARVVLVAHDPSAIPDGFAVVEVRSCLSSASTTPDAARAAADGVNVPGQTLAGA